MSNIDSLIKELCPNGVERKKLREVSDMQRGTSLTKAKAAAGDIPVISGGKEPAFYCDAPNREGKTITVAGSGAGAGYVQYWEIPIFANDCFTIKGTELTETKYLYYFLTSVQDRISGTKKGGGVPHVHISDIENFELPVPPLEVQREIVRVLDSFTLLTAELTAELTARRKQYEFYRDQLLSFADAQGGAQTDVTWLPLGDVCKFVRGPFGGALKKEIFQLNGYAVYEQQHAIYRNLQFRYYVDEKKFNELKRFAVKPGDMIVSCSGTIGRTFVIPDDAPNGIINQALLKLTPTDKLNVFYLQYFFENTISKILNDVARGGAIKNVPSVSELKSIELPLPPIEKQREIVAILDRFDALCNDISEGLPAEIEARQKQYEYYRDKLLSFN